MCGSTLCPNEEYSGKISGVREHVGLGKGFEAINDLLKVHGPDREIKVEENGAEEVRDFMKTKVGCCAVFCFALIEEYTGDSTSRPSETSNFDLPKPLVRHNAEKSWTGQRWTC